MLRRSPLKQVSPKRAAERTEYDRAVQRAFARDRHTCRAATAWPEVACQGRLDPHHIGPVSRFPELRCEVSNLAVSCRAHHDAIHANPVKARELGLLR